MRKTIALNRLFWVSFLLFAAVSGAFPQRARFIDTVIAEAARDTGRSLAPNGSAALLAVDTDEEKAVAKLVTEKLFAALQRGGLNIVQASDVIPSDVHNAWIAPIGKRYGVRYTLFGSVHRLDALRYWLWLRIVDAETAEDRWSEHYVFVLTPTPADPPEEEERIILECRITQTGNISKDAVGRTGNIPDSSTQTGNTPKVPEGEVHLRIEYTAYSSFVNIEKIDKKNKTLTDQPRDARKPKNVCFVIDVSGSMGGSIGGASKMYLVQQALAYLMDDWIQYGDYVSLALFDHRPPDQIPGGVFAPARSLRTGADREALNAAVSNLHPWGGTYISPGLLKGYELVRRNFRQDCVNTVVLLTDGQTFGEDREFCKQYAAENRAQGIATATFALGDDADKPLMTEIAQLGGGLSLSLTEQESSDDLANRLVWLMAGKPEELYDSTYDLKTTITPETGVKLKDHPGVSVYTEKVKGKEYKTIELTAVLSKTSAPNSNLARVKIEHTSKGKIISREYQVVLGGDPVEISANP
ncbi:MAG: VWA domain-containing protein [Spirochaetaceae bacterium]|jgi:Mg-chelatase subunit ChlD/TolB-like protein|nr:VWA domain-containing protein [Spirochaetaceae bacterium]